MANTNYTLIYPDPLPQVEYANQTGMRRYLEDEIKVWDDFLSFLRGQEKWQNLRTRRHGSVSVKQLASSLERLLEALEDRQKFGQMQQAYHGHHIVLPPPSTSLEGQLILGLITNERRDLAACVYLWFAARQDKIVGNANNEAASEIELGKDLFYGAQASAALPFNRVSSQRIAGAARTAENQAQSLHEEVLAAQAINQAHGVELDSFRSRLANRMERIEKVLLRRERKRQIKDSARGEVANEIIDEKAHAIDVQLRTAKLAWDQQQEKRNAEFEQLKALFMTHMRLRAPVELWNGRAERHTKNARTALAAFFVFSTIAIVAGAFVPWALGDYIAGSFVSQVCDPEDAANCVREFSAKGPLTVAGLLLVMSLVLWIVRLQYRVYLSERHLSLDASEKRAFAETYLAMKEGTQVGSDNEAIVLASLFRPTQDGIIKDDDSSLALSAAAILAKQMGRGP